MRVPPAYSEYLAQFIPVGLANGGSEHNKRGFVTEPTNVGKADGESIARGRTPLAGTGA